MFSLCNAAMESCVYFIAQKSTVVLQLVESVVALMQWEHMSVLLLQWDHMWETGVKPHLYTYNAKVKAESIVGDFDAAFRTIGDMLDGDPQPNATTWQAILEGAHLHERFDVVEEASTGFDRQAVFI